MGTLQKIALFCFMLFLVSLVGYMDAEDAQNADAVYCEMVEDGTWPDYKGIKDEICN